LQVSRSWLVVLPLQSEWWRGSKSRETPLPLRKLLAEGNATLGTCAAQSQIAVNVGGKKISTAGRAREVA